MKALLDALKVAYDSLGITLMITAHIVFALIILNQGLNWLFNLFAR